MPGGDVEFSGQAHYAAAALNRNRIPGAGWTASGYYGSRDIRLPYTYFHEGGVQTDGNFEVANGASGRTECQGAQPGRYDFGSP